MTAQPRAGQRAHCSRCQLAFNVNEWRVAAVVTRAVSSRSHAGHKWLHLTCVDGPLPPATGMENYAGLAVGDREDLEGALARRGGPVLPVQEGDAPQEPVPPEAAPAEAAAAVAAAAGPPGDPSAYGENRRTDPLSRAQEDPPLGRPSCSRAALVRQTLPRLLRTMTTTLMTTRTRT